MNTSALLNRICGFHSKTTWADINYNTFAKAMNWATNKPNPLLNPDYSEWWKKKILDLFHADFAYGGLHEDRSTMWRGSYMQAGFMTHLGLDLYVHAGCSVYCPVDFVIRDVFIDKDQNGGWGGRVLVETKPGKYVIFAHILPCDLPLNVCLLAGTRLGYIESKEKNGGWSPHLHLQTIKNKAQLINLDGYGACPENFSNPLEFLQ